MRTNITRHGPSETELHQINVKFVMYAVIVLSLFAVVGNAQADAELTPHRATYKVRISLLGGEMRSRLDLADGEYFVGSTVDPKGLARLIARGSIKEHSKFTTASGRVRPERYSSSDTLSSDGQEVQIFFDWNARQALGVAGTQAVEIPLTAGVVDRASLQYALMLDLLNDRLRKTYVLLEAEGLKELIVSVKGEKTIRVPFGEYRAVGIAHRAESSSRETILWCAPSLGFLPVVIEQFRDGKVRGSVVLTEYEALPEAVPRDQ